MAIALGYVGEEKERQMTDDLSGASRPELPPASLLVECAQSWVHGWTENEMHNYGERCAELRTRELRCVLQELRIRLHAQGRRPEECYEMSLIDNALRA